MSEQNKAIIRRFIKEVQNQHKVDAIDEFFSADCKDHSRMVQEAGPEAHKQFFSMMFNAFPDASFTVHDMLAEGDRVVTRKTFQATYQGDFMGIPATGKQVSMQIFDMMRVADGKITDHWAVADMLGLMQQMGVVPSE